MTSGFETAGGAACLPSSCIDGSCVWNQRVLNQHTPAAVSGSA